MILDLTIDNLQNAGYTEEEINRLYNAKNDFTLDTLYKSKNIFVSKTENKFYTGIDFYRKTYFYNGNLRFPFMCTDLFSEYFELVLNKFLEKQKIELSIHFDKKAQINKFITKETISNRQIIDENKEYIKSNPKRQWIGKERTINILETYIDFLDNKLFINNQSQQSETVNPDEKYKAQNLFKVGLLFATGKMNKYFTVNSKDKTVMNEGYSAPKIANELKNKSFEKWILATINNYPTENVNGNKNVFNSLDMMTKIIDHCKAKKTEIDPYFTSRLPID